MSTSPRPVTPPSVLAAAANLAAVRPGGKVPGADAVSFISAVCIFCTTAAFGAATDTSWAYRFESGTAGWGNSPHGTIATFSSEARPQYSRSGRSLRIDYCLGADQNCAVQEDNFYSSWMSFQNFQVTNRHNTVVFWVKRNNTDPHDRDIGWGFNLSGVGVYSTPGLIMPANDTAGRIITFPLVSLHPSFYTSDKTKPMPVGTSFENCFSIGARDTVMVGKTASPKYPGSGTLWLDDVGLYFDPKNPPFPGPFVPPVSIDLEHSLVLKPLVSRDHPRAVVQPAAAYGPGMRIFDLIGRMLPTAGDRVDAGVYIMPGGRAVDGTPARH